MIDDHTIFVAVFVVGMLCILIYLVGTNSHGNWKEFRGRANR